MIEEMVVTNKPQKPVPLHSLVASAKRLTAKMIEGRYSSHTHTAQKWQDDAWEMYDLVGEQRFLAATLANRQSQAQLYVGTLADDPLEPPERVEDPSIQGILEAVGDNPGVRAQLVQRMAVNLFVAGDGWLVGIPRSLFPSALLPAHTLAVAEEEREPFDPNAEMDIEDLEWRMLSVSEVRTLSTGQVELIFGESIEERIQTSPDNLFLCRVWRPHPRRWWDADSPTRSSLPVLRELVGLTMHVSAQIDSRLAGAGLLIVPQSAQVALNIAAGREPGEMNDEFTEALMEAMIAPIQDRAHASALVPLVVTVPDESVDSFKHLTFAQPIDAESRSLREEALRRLALGQDAPPELLLGTAGMNHWGAWLVREDVVTTHVEPPLALICDALTTQYLWPVLMDQGMDEATAKKHVIWYSVEHLVMRPNRADDAKSNHEVGAISDATLRDATGFSEDDAPSTEDIVRKALLDMVVKDPALLGSPGVDVLRDQLTAIVEGTSVEIPEGMEPEPVPEALAEANAEQAEQGPVEGEEPATEGAETMPPAEEAQP